ncbi:metallophosphoesterase family protein [Brevibacillus fluminis]|uniref:metallophosphoesterase family protein n=1 Tax=Brevibacillus fluminis TaxID=511487 RepID=UPI003F8C2FD1
MKRMLAISDIHGELAKLTALLQEANYDPEADQLILVGDYIDRGPNAREVLDKVMELQQGGAIVLRGNHEEMLVRAWEKREAEFWQKWTKINGGDQTLRSYQVDPNAMFADVTEEQAAIIQKHVDYIKSMPVYYETDQYIFVHGGVHPTTPPAETDPYVLVWIRDEFHHGYNGEKPVIFGHTPTERFHGEGVFEVYFGANNIIGIDGGAVYGGRLNCLELPSRSIYFVE